MSYFSHAFNKAFVGTKPTQPSTGTQNAVNVGMLNQAGIPTSALKNASAPNGLGVGTYGFFNKTTYLSVTAASTEVTTGQSLILAGASLMGDDKIGPFHGGYQESNKSKYINPKLVTNFYKMTAAAPQQAVWHIGNTNFLSGTTLALTTPGVACAANGSYTNVPVSGGAGTGMTVDVVVVGGVVVSVVENQVGTGYVVGNVVTLDPDPSSGLVCDTYPTFTVTSIGAQTCEFEFLCGETYNLYIQLYGNPVLRYLNHDSYRSLAAYTGCCPDGAIAPVAVDSTLVMINWANQMITSPYLKEFIRPVVFDEVGNPWFATAAEALAEGWPATQVWTNYVSTGHIPGALAGIRILGAYVDTRFGTCTFQTSDYYQKEVVRIWNISLTDENGDPCAFNGLCVAQECCGFGGQGFGDTYVRELILSESYLQNKFSTDLRIREITQGTDIFNALPPVNNLNQPIFYDKYVIQHVVPRYNNPSSVHDDDQYNLMIYVPTGAPAAALENFMQVWLIAAGNPLGDQLAATGIETFGHIPCVIVPIPTPVANLAIAKTVTDDTPNVGDTITFTVTVTNLSATDPATGVVVTDNIPNGYTVGTVTPSVGTWAAPTWTIGTLAPGASATLTIAATVLGSGTYNNTATVTSTPGQDPVPGNNTVTRNVTPNPVIP